MNPKIKYDENGNTLTPPGWLRLTVGETITRGCRCAFPKSHPGNQWIPVLATRGSKVWPSMQLAYIRRNAA